jgi:hypothetical protein
MIPPLQRFVSYRKERPDTSDESDAGKPGPNLLTAPRAGDEKKVHIKWNVDIDQVQQWFEENAHAAQSDLGDSRAVAAMPGMMMQRRTCSRRTCSRRDLGFDLDEDSLPFPAYDDGQHVEYFSCTHQQWVSATIHSEARPSTTSGQRFRVCNNVTLSHGGQSREDVGLDAVRAAFRPGEMVEVFSGREDGIRLAAIIAAEQPRAASVVGYTIQIERSGEVLSSIPSLRLKRRFPRGQEIEVYRGAQLGWQKAQVHHTASADGCAAEILPAPAAPAGLTDADAAR